MVTTVYYNGKKLKTQLEDTDYGSNRIHAGGIFVLGQESVGRSCTNFNITIIISLHYNFEKECVFYKRFSFSYDLTTG